MASGGVHFTFESPPHVFIPCGRQIAYPPALPGVRSRLLLPVRTHIPSRSRGRWLIWS